MTTICMATGWLDMVPLKSIITAKSVADALIGVFGRFGMLFHVVSDSH